MAVRSEIVHRLRNAVQLALRGSMTELRTICAAQSELAASHIQEALPAERTEKEWHVELLVHSFANDPKRYSQTIESMEALRVKLPEKAYDRLINMHLSRSEVGSRIMCGRARCGMSTNFPCLKPSWQRCRPYFTSPEPLRARLLLGYLLVNSSPPRLFNG